MVHSDICDFFRFSPNGNKIILTKLKIRKEKN